MERQLSNPSAMDIFEVQLYKGVLEYGLCHHRAQTIACAFLSIALTILAIERKMLENITHALAAHCRAAIWLANS